MSAKRVLVSAYYTPAYDQDSGAQRIFDMIVFLREAGWAVTFLAANAGGDARHARALEQLGVGVFDGSQVALDDLVTRHQVDLAIFAFWQLAEFQLPVIRRLSPATRVIVDSVDLQFLRDARRTFHVRPGATSSGLLDADYAAELIGEVNTYAAADAVLAVSEKEAGLIEDVIGDARLAQTMPDNEELAASTVPFQERAGILFVGSFQHSPNIEAVEYLCKELVPRLGPAVLDAHPVYIVGSGMDETVRRYGKGLPQVRMVGWVPRLEPYLERARITVLPLLYGAGTKRKMIQALMSGTPTVSTTIGIEGLGLRDREHVLVADEPEGFATATTRLLKDERLWRRLARRGREHIVATRGREVARQALLQAIEAVFARPAKPSMLPDSDRRQYERRMRYQRDQHLIPRIRDAVQQTLEPGVPVIVASEGGNELLKLDGRPAWHFPQDERGDPLDTSNYPADADAAIAQLEALRARGGEYFLVPHFAKWVLDYFPGLKQHLDRNYRQAFSNEEVGLIFALDPPAGTGHAAPVVGAAHDTLRPRAPSTGDVWGDAVPRLQATGMPAAQADVRLIAFYLPQYHPIPENDAWWGEGFTEWTNVAGAEPHFPGHYQPHVPADLGFYDLRLAETRQEQASLAREYGIHGFCYYHYWFNGKRLLERPFEEVLASGTPDLPFCLAWANEPWSRRWDGSPHEVLQEQSYGHDDDLAHIRWLLPALGDRRAITIEGKPAFLVYQARELPDPARTVEIWREEVHRAGLPGLYLIAVETGWDAGWDATQVGFDAKVLFQPQFSILRTVPRIPIPGNEEFQVYDYHEAWPVLANPEPVPYRRYDTVFPSWDNSPRRGEKAVVLHNSTPEAYEQWLRHAVAKARTQAPEHRIVFLNAWNEWGEGCHLEPDLPNGRAYLEATRRALSASQSRELHTLRQTRGQRIGIGHDPSN